MLKSFSAVIAVLTLGCATALANGPLRLDEFTQIVAGKDGGCWNDLAKNELALYLGKITGKKLILLESSQAVPGRGTLYLGSAAAASGLLDAATLKQVADEGFAVASDGTNVAIYGRPGRPGMVYGVYAFLRRVGVEFYAENCEELPPPGATVPVFKLQANPAFDPYIGSPNFYYFPQVFSLDVLMRWGYSPYCVATQSPEQVMFAPGLLDQDFTRRYGKWAASSDYHVAGWLVPTHLYLKEHPEYYARGKDGVPLITEKTAPECVQLCLSNPDVYKIVLSRLAEWMDKTPAVKYYSLTVGDSWDYCQCPACRKLDPPNAACFPGERWPVAHMSDRYLGFVNRLARDIRARHPGKILLAGIYQPTCQPPQLVKAVEPNVRVILCPYYTDGNKCASHGLACPENAVFLENFKRWHAIAPDQIQIFDYPMNYATIYEPFFSLDSMVDRVKFFHRNGVKGITFCGQPYLFCRLFMYVLGPLRWDPEQPVKPLETRFLKAYYGPAAAAMGELLALARTQINEKQVHQSSSGSGCTLASQEFVSGAYRIFKKAEQASAGKPPYDERVKYEKLCGVLWVDLNQYVIKDELHRFSMLKELAEICRSAKDPSSVTNLPANTGITMARWLDENFSIRQDAEPWYESTAVKELRACAGPAAVKAFVGGLKKRVKCTQVPEGEFLRLPLNGFNVMGPN
ncbi:MAG: DUF4838 domain-containing protein, partial [bacterium]